MPIIMDFKFPRLKRILRGLDGLSQDQSFAMAKAAQQGIEDIAGDAKELTPVDFGTLKATVKAKELEFTSSYVWQTGVEAGGPAAPYAEVVHEMPHSDLSSTTREKRAQQGTQWKYIETPWNAKRRGVETMMLAAMRKVNNEAFRR